MNIYKQVLFSLLWPEYLSFLTSRRTMRAALSLNDRYGVAWLQKLNGYPHFGGSNSGNEGLQAMQQRANTGHR
jgi:hypothetical protein